MDKLLGNFPRLILAIAAMKELERKPAPQWRSFSIRDLCFASLPNLHLFLRFSIRRSSRRKAPSAQRRIPPRASTHISTIGKFGIVEAGASWKEEITCIRPASQTSTRGDTCHRGKQQKDSLDKIHLALSIQQKIRQPRSVHTACRMYYRITRIKWLIMATTGTRNTFPSPAASKTPTTFSAATRINDHQSSGRSGEAKEVTDKAFVYYTNGADDAKFHVARLDFAFALEFHVQCNQISPTDSYSHTVMYCAISVVLKFMATWNLHLCASA